MTCSKPPIRSRLCSLTLLTCLLAGCGSDSSESHSGTNGQRPPDVSEEEWNKVKTQFQRGTGSSNKDAETAADAIFKFERARKARSDLRSIPTFININLV